MESMRSPRRPSSVRQPEAHKEFLALDDVSFTIPRGEAVGVMGHNGAGKSTLLKILSRITEPTSGSATLFGRVGSLLEVGTGFHLELSGRENIYLSGAIIGMRRSEIRARFDEIVSFAEVEQFIDTPVKHYSSGMHLRLAFAVAAHLQPEILLIDEVLAVGDARFQQKCIGKMDDVAASGRTVLFVSHNLAAIKDLCRSGIVLSQGRLLTQGPVVSAISTYTESTRDTDFASASVGWQNMELTKDDGRVDWTVQPQDPTTYRASLILPEAFASGIVVLIIHDATGSLIVHQRQQLNRTTLGTVRPVDVFASLPPLWLAPGLYTVHFKFLGRSARGADAKYVSERRILDVRGWSHDRASAALAPACQWRIESVLIPGESPAK